MTAVSQQSLFFNFSMFEQCQRGSSALSLDLSIPQHLVTWPGWESRGDVICHSGQTGWWPVGSWLVPWSSCVYVWRFWLVSMLGDQFNISRMKQTPNPYQISPRCSSFSVNTDGLRSGGSGCATARCSRPSTWKTTLPKAPWWPHKGRSTGINRLGCRQTQLNQVGCSGNNSLDIACGGWEPEGHQIM